MPKKDATPTELKMVFTQLGVPTDRVKFDKLSSALAAAELPPDWEAPRVLPPSWSTVRRGQDGAQYRNVAASLVCVLSCAKEQDGRFWLHMSVSHKDRTPTWGELRVTKELFLGDREAIQILPPKDRYVNLHPHALHLFAPMDLKETIGLPDFTRGTGSL